MYTAMTNPENPGSRENLMQGSGVLARDSKVMSAPTYYETSIVLDLSIAGEGFFPVSDGTDRIMYTRDGNFQKAEVDGEIYLVTSQGHFVLDENMQRIPLDGGEITVRENGEVEGTNAKIGVMYFPNPEGLTALGGNLYMTGEASGVAYSVERPRVVQRMTEGSNVSLADEMTELIKAQRAYQMAAKAVNTADEMEALANNLRT